MNVVVQPYVQPTDGQCFVFAPTATCGSFEFSVASVSVESRNFFDAFLRSMCYPLEVGAYARATSASMQSQNKFARLLTT